MAANIRPPITIPVGSFKPSIPKTSMIDGIEGKKPSGTQMKNGSAMAIPNTLKNFLIVFHK